MIISIVINILWELTYVIEADTDIILNFFYKVKPKLIAAYSLSQQLVSEPLKGSGERKPQLALHSV